MGEQAYQTYAVLLALLVLGLGPLVWAVTEWFRQKHILSASAKVIWLVLILGWPFFGPLLYLLAGRRLGKL